MAHPQTTPRGMRAAQRIDVGSQQLTSDSTGLVLNNGIKVSNKANAVLTGDSTGLVVVGDINIANKRRLNANSTGFLPSTVSALPGDVQMDGIAFIKNSTGVLALAINTTGTTWKYLNVTSLIPT